MKASVLSAALMSMLVAACLGPSADAPSVAYHEPHGRSADFHGMPNIPQQRHLYTAIFPRLLPAEKKLLRRINAQVNRDLHYLPDWRNYGVADYPVTEPKVRRPLLVRLPPARYADCEDFALTKKERLARAGFSPTRTFVATATVPDGTSRTLHSALAVPEGSEWWILNNWDNQIQRASSLERWWGWKFIRPHFDSYLRADRTRIPPAPDDAALAAPAADALRQ